MSPLLDCVIGLGANLGNREQALTRALERLGDLGHVVAISNLYENPAVGGPPQPDYLNGALRLRTALEPTALLDELLRIEQLAGRERRVPWGPRTLDLDLLLISDRIVAEPSLTVPHALLTERAFALLPLLEVAPNARSPLNQQRYAVDLARLDASQLRLAFAAVGPPWHWRRPRSTGQEAAVQPCS